MYKKRHSLVFRLAMPFALLLLVTMGGLSIYLSNYLQNSYLEILRDNLQAETRLVADRLGEILETTGSSQAIHERVQRYADLLDVRVTIIDLSGRVISESHTTAQEMENHLGRPEVQAALRSGIGTELRYSNTLQNQMLYTAVPITANGEVVGVARLAVSLRSIQRTEAQLINTILIALGLATVLAILLAFLVASYTIYPLKQLTATVQHVADGELIEIGSTSRRDEIGQLQHTFQLMANQLKEQIDNLRTERGKLEAVLENMTDGIIIVDADGIVHLINPAALELFNTTEDKAVSRSIVEVVRSHQLVDLWRRSIQSSEQQTTTLEMSPGRQFIQGIATRLNGALAGMTLLLFQDLTRVRKLETVRRDFVSNVSHELRTPLASLKALTETLQEGALEDPPAARRFLQRMETEIDNLTQMVHELLELSRIESNKFPLRRILIPPCDVAAPSVERMQLQAERAGLSLKMACPNDLPFIKADPERLQQVLVNLIHNAIKFTPPGGEIEVSAYRDKEQVIFRIRDTGVGIPDETLPRIFERFYKVDRSRSGGGTGLGLSIARHIIETHGGKIWAESTVNAGSTFYFSLPIR